MNTRNRIVITMGALVTLGAGCGDGTLSMADEIDAIGNHQAALEVAVVRHGQQVQAANDPVLVRAVEDGFWQTSVGHVDEMDHHLQNMRDMCSMHGRLFDGAAMAETMDSVRGMLGDHRSAMGATTDVITMHGREGAFADTMAALMRRMDGQQADARASAAEYTCYMHGMM